MLRDQALGTAHWHIVCNVAQNIYAYGQTTSKNLRFAVLTVWK